MKRKFNIIISGLSAMAFIAFCGMPCAAGAQQQQQQPDEYYNNQQQPAPQQYDDSSDQYDDGQQQDNVDFNTFNDALSPYGTWETDPTYGQVWTCNDPDFIPYYSGGSWAYSEAGWAWNSTYAWGWAPFHYGRWAYTNRWMWVPGYQWAPAWVAWRSGGDYYGWAPLGPGINVGVGIGYGGYYPAARWNFCQRAYITNANFSSYCVNRSENVNIIRNTTIINNVNVYHNSRFIAGPERTEVERYTGNRINTVAIRNASGPGATRVTSNEFRAYRPTTATAANRGYNSSGYSNNNQVNAPRQNNAARPNGQEYNAAGRAPQYTERQNQPQQREYQPQQREYQPQQRQQEPARPEYQPQQREYQPQQRQAEPARPQYQPQQQNRQKEYNPARPATAPQQRSASNSASRGGYSSGRR